MTFNMELHKLGECCVINPDRITSKWQCSEIKYIDISAVGEGIFLADPKILSMREAPSRAQRLLVKGDTLLSTVRPNRRSMVWMKEPAANMVASTGFAVLRANPSIITPRYLYYIVFDKSFTEYLVTREQGAAYPAVNSTDIAEANIQLPSLVKQKSIEHILGSIDDRIDLLKQTNQTLEAIAQTIFKSWFVNFDPVHAKQQGIACAGLDAETAELFPDSFIESELGLIPEGWAVGQIGDLGEVVCGKTPSTNISEYYGDLIPFITIPDMHDTLIVSKTNRYLSLLGANSQPKKYLQEGSVCVSCIATPGLVAKVTRPSQTNQQINSVVPYSEWGDEFVLFCLRRVGSAVKTAGSGGSVFHNLNTSSFKQLQIILPSRKTTKLFDKLVKPIIAKIINNSDLINNISLVRDTLLPRLISGKLDVSAIEAQLEEMA